MWPKIEYLLDILRMKTSVRVNSWGLLIRPYSHVQWFCNSLILMLRLFLFSRYQMNNEYTINSVFNQHITKWHISQVWEVIKKLFRCQCTIYVVGLSTCNIIICDNAFWVIGFNFEYLFIRLSRETYIQLLSLIKI